MTIEVGKFYVDGYGCIHYIESIFNEGMWTTNCNLFDSNGQYFDDKTKRDLIMEIDKDDYKVFLEQQINKHIKGEPSDS